MITVRSRFLLVIAAVALTGVISLLWNAAGPDDDPALVLAPSSLAPLEAEIDAALESAGVPAVEWVFAGSQSLVSQVTDGAPADVIITADRISFDAALAAGFDGVDGDSGLPIATNHLVFAIAPGNPGAIDSLAALTDPDRLIGLCAAEVPCGRLATTALDAVGLDPEVDTLEASARALTTKIRSGELDGGLIYRSDATTAALEVVDAEALIDTTTEYWSTWRGDPKHSAFMTFLRSVEFEQILLGAGFGS